MGIVATLQALIALGIDVAPFVEKLALAFQPGAPPPTVAQLDALRQLESDMSAQIQAPLPPEEA